MEKSITIKAKSLNKKLTPTPQLEFFFTTESQVRTLTNYFSKNLSFSTSAEKQLAEKMKSFADDKEPLRFFALHFEDGRQLHLYLINKNTKTFALHSFVRKNSLSALNEVKKDALIRFHDVERALQSRVVDTIASLLSMGRWKPQKFSQKKDQKKSKSETTLTLNLYVDGDLSDSSLQELVNKSDILSAHNNDARRLSDLPSNILNPKTYRDEIQKRARAMGYKFQFFGRPQLLKMKAGAFLAVTQAHLNDAGGIVHLSHKPKGALKKIVFVGKGLCFDTGGYNIKTAGYMYGMHRDMAGSAVALNIFESMIELSKEYEVHAFLAIAENLISHQGFKPNDVVTAMDGTTIEVIDTDAEGRMVLSDTLALARKQKADLMIDFATLTGSAIYSIGTARAAVFSNQPDLLPLAVEAGEVSGERVWGFPLGEDYKDKLKSKVADFAQCSTERGGDHIYAATFLSHFVGEETPWVHVDQSCITNSGGLGLVASDSTAFGIRWAHEFVERFFNR